MNTVYYGGTAEDWKQISITHSEDPEEYSLDVLTSATVYYYSAKNTENGGNTWYYDDDGIPTKWN